MDTTGWRRGDAREAMLIVCLALAAFPACAQQVKKTEKPLAMMVDRALGGSGMDAQLPPHLANAFGLTPRLESIAVKQVAYPMKGTDVIAFNVSVRNHADIVIFRGTETTRTYYLTSPGGALRKVIQSTRISPDSEEFATKELRVAVAKDRFEKEKQCWVHVGKTALLSSECYFAGN